jgi:seryl-tRNA synthetase
MLDIKFIRDNADVVRDNCTKKNTDPGRVDSVLEFDEQRRHLITEAEDLKAKRNSVSAEVAAKKKAGESADELITEMRGVGERIKALDELIRDAEHAMTEQLMWIPNIAHDSVPVGKNENDNVEIRRFGTCAEQEHRVDHVAISDKLGILDFDRGSKVTGSGYGFYVGKGARLERALINYFLDTNTGERGYSEIMTPFVANADSMRGTAQLPKSADDMYHIERDELYLIPTAEVTITNFHRDEILPETELPIKYAGYSACFRREAGSYGKDTRGFLRVHQFNKVELVKFTKPEDSYTELEGIAGDVEHLLQALGLSYRVLTLCTGDMTFAGAKTYDFEVWAPYEQRWLEVSSCTNFGDYQARRANIRFKPDPKAKPEFVHTLNGSGIATSRIMVAILEQYQNENGGLDIPKVLQPYCGFSSID